MVGSPEVLFIGVTAQWRSSHVPRIQYWSALELTGNVATAKSYRTLMIVKYLRNLEAGESDY